MLTFLFSMLISLGIIPEEPKVPKDYPIEVRLGYKPSRKISTSPSSATQRVYSRKMLDK